MIDVSLGLAKESFFDKPRVLKRISRAERKVLSRFGAFVRQRAKTSMRRRKSISPPGSPPHAHTGLLRRFLFFSYDEKMQSVVIGPTRIRGGASIPRRLEEGGYTKRPMRRGIVKQLYYRPRPYMGPAFAEELPRVPQMWQDAIEG